MGGETEGKEGDASMAGDDESSSLYQALYPHNLCRALSYFTDLRKLPAQCCSCTCTCWSLVLLGLAPALLALSMVITGALSSQHQGLLPLWLVMGGIAIFCFYALTLLLFLSFFMRNSFNQDRITFLEFIISWAIAFVLFLGLVWYLGCFYFVFSTMHIPTTH